MEKSQLSDWAAPLQSYLTWKFHGFSAGAWIAFGLVTAAGFVVLLSARKILTRYLGRIRERGELEDLLVSLIAGTRTLVLLVLSFYLGSMALTLSIRAADIIATAAAVAIVLQIGLWGNQIISYAIRRGLEHQAGEDQGLATAVGALNFISRTALWTIVALLILGSLQVNITSLIAGLGIGGVAVALAVQNILGDLFASLSILIDKPFAVGHFIVIDTLAGTVEHVGVKSTRVRSLSGEEIVLSNGDLLKSRIHNYKRLFERRVLFGFGVTYDTPHDKLAAIPAQVRRIIEGIEKTRFDRAHFKEFGESSLNFEVVYYVLDPDYNLYMDIQQAINLGLARYLAREGVEFAFPSRTIYLAPQPAETLPKDGQRGVTEQRTPGPH